MLRCATSNTTPRILSVRDEVRNTLEVPEKKKEEEKGGARVLRCSGACVQQMRWIADQPAEVRPAAEGIRRGRALLPYWPGAR